MASRKTNCTAAVPSNLTVEEARIEFGRVGAMLRRARDRAKAIGPALPRVPGDQRTAMLEWDNPLPRSVELQMSVASELFETEGFLETLALVDKAVKVTSEDLAQEQEEWFLKWPQRPDSEVPV